MLVTVTATTVPNYEGTSATATLRIYATQNFFNDGVEIVGSRRGSSSFYKSVDCTITDGIITIPEFEVESTTDSSDDTAKYIAVLYDELGTEIAVLGGGLELSVPPITPTSWTTLTTYNQTVVRTMPDTYLDANQTAALLSSKQDNLISGTTLKTVNSTSLLGSGDVTVQPTLVSGTNIKTVNGDSVLGSGDIDVQDTLVSGSNIKTVNSASLLGSGDVAVQPTLVSGTNIKTVNSASLLGAGDVAVQPTLVSGTNIKTVNSNSLLGAGDLVLPVPQKLSNYASLAAAVSAIGSDVTVLEVDTNDTVSTAVSIPTTLILKNAGGLLTKSGSGTIEFLGAGLDNPESSVPCFSGFTPGDVTWSGSIYPGVITTSLWDDADLSDKLLNAIAAMNGNKVTIKAFPGNFGSQWTLRQYQSLYLTRGTYTNTVDAEDQTLFTLESDTCVYGDGMGQTIIEESSALTRNVRLFRSSGGNSGANENIEIRDLQINGHANQAWFDNGPTTILLGNCTNGHVRRVKIKDTHAYGVYIGGFRDLGNYPKECSITDCIFDHVIAQNCGILNGRNCRIERNTFVNLGSSLSDPISTAIDVEPNSDDETVENVLVRGNLIDARGAQQSVNGIIVQYGGSKNGIASGDISANTIIGYDISSGATDRNLLNGITLTGGYGVSVTGNKIQGTLQSGIYLTNGRYLNVHDNTLMDTGAVGVYGMRVESIADSNFVNNTLTKRSGFSGTDDTMTELATSQPATSSGSTITTQSFVLPHWAGLEVTFNATDYTVNTVTDFSHFTTTVAVGTVSNLAIASATDIDTGTNTFTSTAHGLNNNAVVRIVTGGTIPGGLTNGDSYYIVNKTANTFQLSLTSGGAAIDITSTGTGTQSIQPMLSTKFGDNTYAQNKRGSVSLLNGSTEYSHMTGTAGIGGATGSTDNAILRADGTGGATLQNSPVTIDDDGQINVPDLKFFTSLTKRLIGYNSGAPAVLINPDKVGTISTYGNAVNFIDSSDNINAKVDNDATAGNTRFLIWDVDNGTLERVSVGAADSGGAGFKVLRIPN